MIFSYCNAQACTATTDQNGYVQEQVRSSVAGAGTVTAAGGGQTVSASFTTLSAAPQLSFVSTPASPAQVGVMDPVPLTIRLLDASGAPMPNQMIEVQGQDHFDQMACGGYGCGLVTGADGTASVTVMPLVSGSIALSADYGATSVTTQFTAVGALRTLKVLEQPGAAGALVNQLVTFQIQILGPDGVTPAPYDTLDLPILAGQISIRQCESSYCRIGSDGNGIATFTGTPIAPGTITIEALDESSFFATATISFVATVPTDGLTVLSAPGPGSTVGSPAAAAFSVRVDGPDGVTPAPGRGVTLTAVHGAAGLGACGGAASCVVTSDASGVVSSTVTPLAAGTVTLTAAEGGGTATASFNAVLPPPDRMVLVSKPADGLVAGQTGAVPFAVQVLGADGVTAATGRQVTLAVSAGQAVLTACGAATCVVTSGVDGVASSGVKALGAGAVALLGSEVSEGQSVSVGATFLAAAAPDVLVVTVAPPGTDVVGTAVPFAVQALLADGVTTAAGKTVSFQVSAGTAALGCGQGTCAVVTDASGAASVAVTPAAVGAVTVVATDGQAAVSVQFNAVNPPPPPPPPPVQPDTLVVVSQPGGSSPVGQANATPFAVEILGPDGVTPAPGRTVTFTVSTGQAGLSACAGAATCTLTTDATGIVSTAVVPAAAGPVWVTAVEVGVQANTAVASFTAVALPVTPPPVPAQELTLVEGPGASVFDGMTAGTPLSVRLTLTDGVTPVAGVPVTFTAAPGTPAGAVASWPAGEPLHRDHGCGGAGLDRGYGGERGTAESGGHGAAAGARAAGAGGVGGVSGGCGPAEPGGGRAADVYRRTDARDGGAGCGRQ